MTMHAVPDVIGSAVVDNSFFRSAFSALVGHEPFGWQERLYQRLLDEKIPATCDIPTGLGKTAVIPIWLIALAKMPGKLPRRLIYVVDRRAVVDQATAEAERMRKRVKDASHDSALGAIRATLQGFSALPDPAGVTISTLRGQFADNHEWDLDVARPAIVIGTVDMIGSRLLFGGYGGLGKHRRSLHAGLLAQDALIAIDEAHLSPAFVATMAWAASQLRRKEILRPFEIMLLTATQPKLQRGSKSEASRPAAEPLRISDEDLAEDEVRQRLRAKKSLRFVQPPEQLAETEGKWKTERDAFAKRMAKEAVALAGDNRAIVIFADTVELLNRIDSALGAAPQKIMRECRLVLTGEMRGKERDEFADTETFRVFQTRQRDRAPLTNPLFLLTTAAGEVGINFDACDAVCDTVALERMAQRLGRVNRFGDGVAKISVILPMRMKELRSHSAELEQLIAKLPELESEKRKKTEKRIDELEKIVTRYATRACLLLAQLPQGESDEPFTFTASPEALSALCRHADATNAYSPSSPPPPLDEARLDDWAFTSMNVQDYARPQVSYWLRGVTPDDTVTTQFAWREDLQNASDEEDAAFMAEALPLAPRELAQVATYRATELMMHLAKTHPTARIAMLSPAGEWSGRRLGSFAKEAKDIAREIAFSTLVLPTTVGGLHKNGLPGKDAKEPVPDVANCKGYPDGDRARRYLLKRTNDDAWSARDLFAEENAEACAEGESIAEVCRKIATNLRPRFKQVHISGNDEDSAHSPRVVYFTQSGARLEASGSADIASLLRKNVPLDSHNELAGEFAEKLVKRLGLPENLAQAVVRAAKLHDLGKNRPRWQKAIGNTNGEPLAKSARSRFDRAASGGYRHEFGSMLEAAEHPAVREHAERDLILHLIAAHHGHARPGFADVAFDCPPRLRRECAQAAEEGEERYITLQRRFGWWQLAWLEALVKSADALASITHDREGGSEA